MPRSKSMKRTLSDENKSENKRHRPSEAQSKRPCDSEAAEAAENLLTLAMADPQRRANFSAIGSTNGMNKHSQQVGSGTKQGTAKKLVIKNFKGNGIVCYWLLIVWPGQTKDAIGPTMNEV